MISSTGSVQFPPRPKLPSSLEDISLLSVRADEMPLLVRKVCLSRERIQAWPNEEVLHWLKINELSELQAYFHDIIGKQLLDGEIISSLSLVVPSHTHKKLHLAWNQLIGGSKDLFDSSAFSNPESQIEALKVAIVRMRLVIFGG